MDDSLPPDMSIDQAPPVPPMPPPLMTQQPLPSSSAAAAAAAVAAAAAAVTLSESSTPSNSIIPAVPGTGGPSSAAAGMPMDVNMSSPQDQDQDGNGRPIKRRAPIACRRCRRLRSKCIHDKGTPPCKACSEAGLGKDECVFPIRGQPCWDREYRHPRLRQDKPTKRDPAKIRRDILDAPIKVPAIPASPPKPAKGVDDWDMLPPLPDIIEAVRKFTSVYFQLGFIPKEQFVRRLEQNPRSVSVFWLTSLLSTAARWTPSLVERYGTGPEHRRGIVASEYFMGKASSLAMHQVYQPPDLERLQAFYLLSIAQQGSAYAQQSYINLGIAIRMASWLGLHREEVYPDPKEARSQEERIWWESARRTLWMLHSQDNLHSGPRSPVSLAASDITTLLPGTEEDFAKGVEPEFRAALEDTPPGKEKPHLCLGQRSLFASLIQSHHFWGLISRRAIAHDKSPRPWEAESDYAKMEGRLREWESNLPKDHTWSVYLLSGHKSAGQDLAYLGVTMVTRLCNIVLRRAYLNEMIYTENTSPEMQGFWSHMASELFHDVRALYEQIDTQFKERQPDESVGAQMASFCVYSCALLTVYLVKFPKVCPDPTIANEGPNMYHRTVAILEESQSTWPLASRWLSGLRKLYGDTQSAFREGTMADGKDSMPGAMGSSENGVVTPLEKRSILQTPPAAPQPPTTDANGVEPLRLPAPVHGQPQSQHQQQPQNPQQQQQHTDHQVPPNQQHPQHPHQHPQGIQHEQAHQAQQVHPSQQPVGAQVPGASGQVRDGLGLLLEAFDQAPNGQAYAPPPQQGTMTHGSFYVPMPVSAAPTGIQQLTPANDGYDAELQMYIDGPPQADISYVQHPGHGIAQPPGPIYTGY